MKHYTHTNIISQATYVSKLIPLFFGLGIIAIIDSVHAKPLRTPKKSHELVSLVHTERDIQALMRDPKTIVVLDVFAQWCPPCQRMAPIFEETAREFKKNSKQILFAKIEIESFDSSDKTLMLLAKNFTIQITLIPTFVILQNNIVLQIIRGSQTKEQLKNIISELLT